jgi:hypothetical protein
MWVKVTSRINLLNNFINKISKFKHQQIKNFIRVDLGKFIFNTKFTILF